MANVTGVRTSLRSGDIDLSNEARHIRYVADRIFQYAPQYTPLLVLTGGTIPGPNGERIRVKGLIQSGYTPAKKVEWYEKDQINRTFYCDNAGATVAAGSTVLQIPVDDGAGGDVVGTVVNPGDIVFMKSGTLGNSEGTLFYVQDASAAGATVNLIQCGGTALVTIGDNCVFQKVGSAMKENSSARTVIDVEATLNYNYMEIFRDDWAISRSDQKIDLYGGPDLAETMATAATNHVVTLETMLMYGKKSKALTDAAGNVVYAMDGLYNIIPNIFGDGTKIISAGLYYGQSIGDPSSANFSSDDFNVMMDGLFTYGSALGRKLFIGGKVFASVWNDMAQDIGWQVINNKETSFGIRISELMGAQGTIYYVPSGACQDAWPLVGFGLQTELLKICYVDNTFMVSNSQNPDVDGSAGYFMTEHTLMVDGTKAHAVVGQVYGYT
jgi:hypothetical protein